MRVDAYLGLGSRYSYLAATQLDQLAEACDAEVTWIPVDSVDLIERAQGNGSPFERPHREGPYTPAFRDLDARRWAGSRRAKARRDRRGAGAGAPETL